MSVFYLEYRPQTISELDNSGGREVLGSILKKLKEDGSIPKSYLFYGPKGAGKTSAARIFAKAVNCQEVSGDACGKCDNCLDIAKGKSMDVMEIDAASNRGIDEVRALKEKVVLAPTRLRNKVIIIDEAQMMTKEAFNALLKLLEEPPLNTYFIMCTTDPQKIPETIISRLVKVEFGRGQEVDLKTALKRVVEREGLEIEPEAIDGLIEKSEGSFRNLHRLLNELVLAGGKKIDKEKWDKFSLNLWGGYGAEQLTQDLFNNKTQEVLEQIEIMAKEGIDFVSYLEELMALVQKRLIESKEKWEWVRLMDLLIEASGQMKYCPMVQVPLQLAVVKFGKKEDQNLRPAEIERTKGQLKSIQEKVKKVTKEAGSNQSNLVIETIQEKWGEVLAKVKPYNHSIEAFLRATKPLSLEGNELTVGVFYPFHKERLEESRNRRVIEEVLKLVFGTSVVFLCKLGKPEPKTKLTEVPEVKAPAPSAEEKGKDLYQTAKEIFG